MKKKKYGKNSSDQLANEDLTSVVGGVGKSRGELNAFYNQWGAFVQDWNQDHASPDHRARHAEAMDFVTRSNGLLKQLGVTNFNVIAVPNKSSSGTYYTMKVNRLNRRSSLNLVVFCPNHSLIISIMFLWLYKILTIPFAMASALKHSRIVISQSVSVPFPILSSHKSFFNRSSKMAC